MESMNLTWRLLFAVSLFVGGYGASILVVLSDPSISHTVVYSSLPKALAARGHHVTVISSHPSKTPLANYTEIVIPTQGVVGTDAHLKAKVNKNADKVKPQTAFVQSALKRCEHFLSNPQVQRLIHDNKIHFNLLITEVIGHECFLGFAHKYKANIIGIYGQSDTSCNYDLGDNTRPYSHILNMFSIPTERPSYQQGVNFSISSLLNTNKKHKHEQLQYANLTKEYFKNLGPLPSNLEVQRRFAFLFFNGDVTPDYSRPLLPNVIDVGGMHLKPSQKLPQHLQDLLDGTKHGVIVFYMGMHLEEFLQDKQKLGHFIEAFSRMKQLVLWQRTEKIPNLASNIHLRASFPPDVLAHPNVRVFVTDGGIFRLQEALYHGVPIVGIPVCNVQFLNMQRVQDEGFGIHLDNNNITSQSLEHAFTTVITQTSYRARAKQISERFLDRLTPPLQKAVFWTEYALRHRGAPHLRSSSLDLPWYKYYLVDVVGVIVTGSILLFIVFVTALRVIFDFLFGPAWSDKKIFIAGKTEKVD